MENLLARKGVEQVAGGRIRTIKPELLEDEKVAGLSDRAFRLFVGCILLSDDHGNLPGSASYLKGQVYWARGDSIEDIQAAIDELVAKDFVYPYQVRHQSYLHIRTWAKHQKIDKPSKPKVPPPETVAAAESATEPLGYVASETPSEPNVHDRLKAMLSTIAEASGERFVVTWKKPARAHGAGCADDTMGLPNNLWRELMRVFTEAGPELDLERCEKLGRWIGAGGWGHLKPSVTPEYLIKHLHEGLTMSQAWDGKPLMQSRPSSGHQAPTWTNEDVSIEEIFEQNTIAKGKKAKGD